MYKALRELRKNKGISAVTLAELLELKTKAAYYKKESGIVKFSVEEARKIAEYFGMQIEEIFFEEEVAKKATIKTGEKNG